LKVEWTQPAFADLVEAQTYISEENPIAAKKVAQKIWDASQKLAHNPEIGRIGHVDETREWVVDQTPYLIVYRIKNEKIEILRVWHSRRNWQN
jgi:toxin ParE1/3/4